MIIKGEYPSDPHTWVLYSCALMILSIKNLNYVSISYSVLTQMIDHFVVIARVEFNSIAYSSH